MVVDGVHLLFDPSSWFDPHPKPPDVHQPVDAVLVSHAHSDHSNLAKDFNSVKKGGRFVSVPILMHPATHDISSRWNKFEKPVFIEAGEKMKLGGIEIQAFNAGHCMGSLQFKVESSEGSLTFTGDINTNGSVVMEPADIIPADYIAIEATMGNPSMVVPPRDEAYGVIKDFVKSHIGDGKTFIVLYGHALGKGQELVKLLNEIEEPFFNIFVDNRTNSLNKIYERYHDMLGEYEKVNMAKLFGGDDAVIVYDLYQLHKKMPFHKKYGITREPPSMIISAFGVEGKDYPIINLSSHDDFNGILGYIKKADEKKDGKPKVIAFHGDHEAFCTSLREQGFYAYDSHVDVLDV